MKKFYYFLLISIIIFPVFGQNYLSAQEFNSTEIVLKKEHFKKLMDSSNLHYENGDYRKDLALNLKLLKLSFEINEPYYIHKGYRNLAYDFLVLGDTLLAKESFEKSEIHAKLSKNDTITAYTFMDLANIYSISEENYDHAVTYHNKSIKLFEKIKDSSGLSKAYYNAILTELEIGDLNKAYVHIISAKKLVHHGDYSYALSLDNLLGQYYFLKDNYAMANKYFERTIHAAEKGNLPIILEDAFYYYSENLSKQENFKAALDARMNYEEYLEINQDKYLSTDVENVSANYLVSEYRKDVQEAELKNRLQAEIVESKSRLNVILIVVAASFLVLFVTLFFAYRNRKKLVSELKEKNKKYLIAKEESEKLAKAKNSFFSTISHELRTPLYGVIGLTTILLEDPTLKSHLKDLKSLKFSADYLLALINDVLQINKIDSKTIENNYSAFNLKDLIKKIVSSFEYMRIQNNNTIHIHISDSIPKFIHGNSVRLSQVLMNLISNACKFTEEGTIDVMVEATKKFGNRIAIAFYVKDTGMGIPKEKHESIFEEFSQLYTNNYKYQGSGLGLPIVKKLLQLDNSIITLKSKEGQGSMFSFTLEYEIVNKNLAEQNKPIIDLSLLKGKRILVAEDNRINQMVTKKIIEKNNMICTIAQNGLEAVEKIKNNNYDLILMDINMPVMNGIVATKEIRALNQTIPILALTAVEIEEMKYSIYESGMNDIIVKPYDITKFVQTISKNLQTIQVPQNEGLKRKAI